jgi:endoglucanase
MPDETGQHRSYTSVLLIVGLLAGCSHSGNLSAETHIPCTDNSHRTVAPDKSLSVKVQGNHLIDGNGQTLQLRGVSVSGLEFVAVQGWSPKDPWGGAGPDWRAIRSWQANAVRIPLNEASWLGYPCVDFKGATHNPDPGGNYKAMVASTVSQATNAGLYVILDLHWSAPANACPLAQNLMADADHSLAFWTSVATQFKSYTNVLFELFNEPFIGGPGPVGESSWRTVMQGGDLTYYITKNANGGEAQVDFHWHAAGMQQMLDAVRANGAGNVILIGTPSWSQDLSQWTDNAPNDPLHQIGVVWHAYPNSNIAGDSQAVVPKLGRNAYHWAEHILAAGYPILITETGDHDAPGAVGAPYLAQLLPWADERQISYLGWTWNVWGNPDDVLIKSAAGAPTEGYGAEFKQHLICLAHVVSPPQ